MVPDAMTGSRDGGALTQLAMICSAEATICNAATKRGVRGLQVAGAWRERSYGSYLGIVVEKG